MGKCWLQVCWMNLTGFGLPRPKHGQWSSGMSASCHALWSPSQWPHVHCLWSYERWYSWLFFPSSYYVVVGISTRDWGNWTSSQHGWAMGLHCRYDQNVSFAQPIPALIVIHLTQTGRWMAQKVRPTNMQVLQQSIQADSSKTCSWIFPIGSSRQHQKPCSYSNDPKKKRKFLYNQDLHQPMSKPLRGEKPGAFPRPTPRS